MFVELVKQLFKTFASSVQFKRLFMIILVHDLPSTQNQRQPCLYCLTLTQIYVFIAVVVFRKPL